MAELHGRSLCLLAPSERTVRGKRERATRGSRWFVTQAPRMLAHYRHLVLRLSRRCCRQRRCSSHVLGHSPRLLLVPPLPTSVASQSPSCSNPPSGLEHRRSRREGFGALHDAGVDEDDLAGLDFAKAEARVDKPLLDDQLHVSGLVRESFRQASFVFSILVLVLLFL